MGEIEGSGIVDSDEHLSSKNDPLVTDYDVSFICSLVDVFYCFNFVRGRLHGSIVRISIID